MEPRHNAMEAHGWPFVFLKEGDDDVLDIACMICMTFNENYGVHKIKFKIISKN